MNNITQNNNYKFNHKLLHDVENKFKLLQTNE